MTPDAPDTTDPPRFPPDAGPDDFAGGSPMDPSRPSGRMRLPTPARAATAAGILLATSVLLLAGDLAVVHIAGDEAHVLPFFVQTENTTVAGMRVTNAGSGDAIHAYEMFATGACGYTYRNPMFIIGDPANATSDSATSTASATATSATVWFVRQDDYRVVGNVSFYVVESIHTADLLRGLDVPTYMETGREGGFPDFDVQGANATRDGEVVRIVRVHVNCQADGRMTLERGPHPGTNVRYAFSSSEPWLSDLPIHQGVDFLYVVRADEQKDNETYSLLAENLQRGSEFWIYSMRSATIFDNEGVFPDRLLRTGVMVTLVGAAALMAVALRREETALPPGPTDAAFALAAAGESHLLRLRRTWTVVGGVLVPLLAAATYLLFNIAFTHPSSEWYTGIGAMVLVLDGAVLALWALALRRAHKDLLAWRAAWVRIDAVDLDAL